MTALIDTDVLLDVVLDRAPHSTAASALLDELERRPGHAFVAWHTLSNFYYLARPHAGGNAAKLFLLELTRFVEVAPTDTAAFRSAAKMRMKDFEDALQAAAALACRADFIVTRNLKDYRSSPVPAIAPAAALKRFST